MKKPGKYIVGRNTVLDDGFYSELNPNFCIKCLCIPQE